MSALPWPRGVGVDAVAFRRTPADALPDDRYWVDALRGDGRARELAVFRLRALLVAVAWFELERRQAQLASLTAAQEARFVRDAAEAACAALLDRLGDYQGQSRFETWAAKFAIHEAATAARRAAAGPLAPLRDAAAPRRSRFPARESR